jgi:hypothetical protein
LRFNLSSRAVENLTFAYEQSTPQTRLPMPRAKARSTDCGARLNEPRKAARYPQTGLANALDTLQQSVACYGTSAKHPPAALLPQMAQAIGASVEGLLGILLIKCTKVLTPSRIADCNRSRRWT